MKFHLYSYLVSNEKNYHCALRSPNDTGKWRELVSVLNFPVFGTFSGGLTDHKLSHIHPPSDYLCRNNF
jgi:hypothetical protein